jgi:DNA polymerase-1
MEAGKSRVSGRGKLMTNLLAGEDVTGSPWAVQAWATDRSKNAERVEGPHQFNFLGGNMRHAIYSSNANTASVAILVKEAAFDSDKIKQNYIDSIGANPSGFIAYSLWYDDYNKCPANTAKEALKEVLHSIKQLGIKIILITDSKYFKYITKENKPASKFVGYKCLSKIEGYEDEFTVFYAPNYQASKHNPLIIQEMDTALDYFHKYLTGNYIIPGKNVVESSKHLIHLDEIILELDWLHSKKELTVDIETKGLQFWNCGIATIAFAWDKNNYTSIAVDRGTQPDKIKSALHNFFENYKGKLIPHNANFDFKVLVFELWMKDLQDYPGMIHGIQVLTKSFDDTKIIAYLATNNAIENTLKLKNLSAAYMGIYEEDIKDTSLIPLPDLLVYNGKDCLATWYVKEKYEPIMDHDGQRKIYEELFKPSVITLLQTELVGLPIFPDKVKKAKRELTHVRDNYINIIQNSIIVKEFQLDVKSRKCAQFTAEAKTKVFTMDDPRITRLVFNPGSPQQVGDLLYNYMQLPIIDVTDTKQPAAGKKTLEKLVNHTTNQKYLDIILALIDLSQVEKILSSFIPAFEVNSVQMPDGSWRLYGNFNLGGTVSGRLSSSNP